MTTIIALDQIRASKVALIQPGLTEPSYKVAAGDEPLTVSLTSPEWRSASQTVHMVLLQVSAFFKCTLQDPTASQGPASGLFLVSNTVPVDTLASGSGDISFDRRGLPLPTTFSSVVIAGVTWVQMTWPGTDRLIVPAGYEVRAIALPAPGTPAPGPGVGSIGLINGLGFIESNING